MPLRLLFNSPTLQFEDVFQKISAKQKNERAWLRWKLCWRVCSAAAVRAASVACGGTSICSVLIRRLLAAAAGFPALLRCLAPRHLACAAATYLQNLRKFLKTILLNNNA